MMRIESETNSAASHLLWKYRSFPRVREQLWGRDGPFVWTLHELLGPTTNAIEKDIQTLRQ